MSEWIHFEPVPVGPDRKTSVWNVVTTGSEKEVGGLVLGKISWWGAWRKYAFFPQANTLYEQTCLRNIAQFIEEQTQNRRKP